MPLVPDMSLGAYASIFQDLDDKTVCLLDGNFSADDLRKVLAVLDPETAQLQARVAELEAALAAEREVHVSVSSASDDELTKTRDALRRLEVSANSVAYCYRHRPENFAGALLALEDDATFAREVSGGQP